MAHGDGLTRSRFTRVTQGNGLAAAYLEQRPVLLRLLSARLGSASEAEDALQDLWLKIEVGNTGPIDHPAAYLFRMANNLATDRRVSAARRGALEAAWDDVQPQAREYPDSERWLLSRDALAQAEARIATMPERMQAAYRLFRIEQVPQREIATRLGVSVSAVEKLLHRAYLHLHRQGGLDDD
jgi:RNA polymerase sigma factor (sigma-70 family)